MENVNQYINIKQYILIPFFGLALITFGWYIGSKKTVQFENDYFSFELEGDWFNSEVDVKETKYSVVKNPLARVTVKELEPYTNSGLGALFGGEEFGIEEGHNLFNGALYDDYNTMKTEDVKINSSEAVLFDLEYKDYSEGDAVKMVGKEILIPIGEELYAIGMFAPQDVSDDYLSSFNSLVSSINIKK